DLSQHDILPEPQPLVRPKPSRIVALWVGVLALLAGGVFGAVYLAGNDAGTPEEAVQRMLDAVSNEDVLGVLSALPPSERDPLMDNVPEMANQLKRLGILSEDFSLGKVKGVDLNFTGVRLASNQIGDGVSAVRITGGESSYRVVPRDLPLGTFVTDIIGKDLPAEAQTGANPITSDNPADTIVTIKENGRWYVSLNYSIAEAARRSSGAPVPKFGAGLQARGASAPDEAVRELVRAGIALDVQRAIELLPPDEGRVLRDYAPLFLDDAKQAAANAGFHADLKALDLDTNRSGSHATVTIKRFDLAFTAGTGTGTVSYDGKCVTLGGSDVPPGQGRVCPDDPRGPAALRGLASRLPAQGIVVVERNGAWYVSPTRTVLEELVGVLKALQRPDLDGLRDFFQGMGVSETQRVTAGGSTTG
ncbi:MAG: hypothetical protein QOJ09_1677, partial [Actinomycetota bacterium]|nr:hypothetical protein [Actinomycetota bacterium]